MTANKKHDPHTLNLFNSATPDSPYEGDGAPAPIEHDTMLPDLAHTELTVTPSKLSAVAIGGRHAVPVFRLQLVRDRCHLTEQIREPEDVARLCSELLESHDREVFLVVALSTANRVIGVHSAHTGTVDASIASSREVYKYALLCNARSIVVAHNHPSGNLEPSSADVQVSKQLQDAGNLIGIRLLDSLVIGFNGHYTSLSERGLI